MPEIKPTIESLAKIKVVGVGGSGGSAVKRMINSQIKGVEFIAVNTDLQALHDNPAPVKVHIGKQLTKGLGAGMNPDVGRAAAEESHNELRDALKDANMVFVTCGLGGGTGSGAGPVIAQIAKESGALTLAVVTKPFVFEQAQRMDIAERAHDQFIEHVDTIITINNDRVLEIVDAHTSLLEAFRVVDDVLRQGVQGIAEVITTPGLINVDFADVRTIMADAGSALMGMGRASGEHRATQAAKMAIASPLLDLEVDGAKGILFMITGGRDLGMHEVSDAAKIITGSADDAAKVIFGACIDETLTDEVRITVIATGFGDARPRSMMKKDALMFGKGAFLQQPPQPREKKEERVRVQQTFETPFKKRDVAPAMRVEPKIPQIPSRDVFDEVDDVPSIPQTVEEEVGSQEEDLEIPAFLRRKLG